MNDETVSAELQRLLGINKSVLGELAERGIVVRGSKRAATGSKPRSAAYCEHLRSMAASRGGEAGATARERLGVAQTSLAEARAAQLPG
jgi:hypothetical protein